MKLLTSNRSEYKKEILALEPYKLSSYSKIDLPELSGKKIKTLILNGSGQIEFKAWEIKKVNKIHAKIAIGKRGVYIGSCNFSFNSLEIFHEIGIIIYQNEAPEICVEVEKYFDKLWEQSKDA